ncbi:MAG: hypothetical protein KDJ75_03660 [Alphaproteobacteria bacterium]|nr:hypothetical protein [Alphaproteobacteria bacterium]
MNSGPHIENHTQIVFEDHEAALANPHRYMEIIIRVPDILESWRESLFSFEWIWRDGRIKTLQELPENERVLRQAVEDKIRQGRALPKPVLGIGLMDNVEIGSGRAVFLVMADRGLGKMPVHIPKSNEEDFKAFLADISS